MRSRRKEKPIDARIVAYESSRPPDSDATLLELSVYGDSLAIVEVLNLLSDSGVACVPLPEPGDIDQLSAVEWALMVRELRAYRVAFGKLRSFSSDAARVLEKVPKPWGQKGSDR